MASYFIVCYFPCELEPILVHINLVLSFISQKQCYANLVPPQEALGDLSWKVKQKLALTKQTDIKTVSKTTLELNLWLTCVYNMCVCVPVSDSSSEGLFQVQMPEVKMAPEYLSVYNTSFQVRFDLYVHM